MDMFNYKIKGKVICDNRIYDTKELIEIVNNTKQFLLNNYSEDKIIAIAMPRCVYLLTSILALLDSRITYLLIDVDLQPKKRINYILNDAGVNTILSISTLEYEFDDRNVIYVDNIRKYEQKGMLCCGNKLAYILYTSGTTGCPKGVEISRDALNNFISGIVNVIKFNSNDRIVSFTSPSFDIFFLEAILPIYFGLTVVLASSEEVKNSSKKIDLIRRFDVNMLQITPSGLRLLSMIDENLNFLNNIHTIMVGGEVFPIELLDRLQLKNNLKIYNMYGPTETTIWSTIADLSNCDYVHLGEPICCTEIFLLDNNLCDVENGEKGEICISGKGLSDGYHGNKELTKRSFCKLPRFANKTVYRTGDIGVLDNNGNLLYVGRIDNQIKLHGHRIELEEIEATILLYKQITSSVVCFNEKNEEIIAFYSTVDKNVDEKIFLELKKYLPKYMIPNKFICVENFIYTSNGKIDRKAVLDRYLKEISKNNIANANCDISIMDTISLVLSKCLHVPNIVVDYNMSLEQVGFDSITYVEFIVELETLLNIDFEENVLVMDNFENLKQLCEYISLLVNHRGA